MAKQWINNLSIWSHCLQVPNGRASEINDIDLLESSWTQSNRQNIRPGNKQMDACPNFSLSISGISEKQPKGAVTSSVIGWSIT